MCLSVQAVMHCSALRHALVSLGGDGHAGEELVELLAAGPEVDDSSGGGGLASVLSPAMLQSLLQEEAATTVRAMWNAQQRGG